MWKIQRGLDTEIKLCNWKVPNKNKRDEAVENKKGEERERLRCAEAGLARLLQGYKSGGGGGGGDGGVAGAYWGH